MPDTANRYYEPASDVTADVRANAARGAALLGARSAAIYALGIVANLVLAHLLVPRDFGVVALGNVLVVLGTYVSEGGFGASLIRRGGEPSRAELEAVNGLQLSSTLLVALVAAAIAIPLGHDGVVIATMVAALPLAVLRTPSVIVLERRLEYRAIATADVLEAGIYYAWAIGGALLGFGVWALATAVVVRAVAGSTFLLIRGPIGLLRPRLSWELTRPLIGFGAQVQGVAILTVAREQILNVVVAAVGGVATLGIWNLAWRVLQVPLFLALTIGRVGFPAMAQLLHAKQDPKPLIARGLGVATVMMGLVAVGLVGLAPALPVLVGDAWDAVPQVLFWSGIALVLGPPVVVATTGYLLAAGRAGAVAIGTAASALVWFTIVILLLPSEGAPAVGIGWVGAAIVNAAVLWRSTPGERGAKLTRDHLAATAVSAVAVCTSWAIAHSGEPVTLFAPLAAAAGIALLLGGMRIVAPRAMSDGRKLVAEGLKGMRREAP